MSRRSSRRRSNEGGSVWGERADEGEVRFCIRIFMQCGTSTAFPGPRNHGSRRRLSDKGVDSAVDIKLDSLERPVNQAQM